MIEIDTRDFRRLAAALGRVRTEAVGRKALTDVAWKVRAQWRDQMADKFTLRNKWTLSSVRVKPAKGAGPAIVGSMEEYVALQEFGATRKVGSIATPYSSGEPRGAKRKRLPRRPMRMGAITLNKRAVRAANPAQARIIKIREAIATGRRFVYLDEGVREGIYKVTGTKPQRAKLQMVHALQPDTVRTPPRPTLAPALENAPQLTTAAYVAAFRAELQRARVGFR